GRSRWLRAAHRPGGLAPEFVRGDCYNPSRQETHPVRLLLSCVLFLSTCLALYAAPSPETQKVLWQKLESSIQQIDQHLDGVMGTAIEDLTSGDHFFLHEDKVFAQ